MSEAIDLPLPITGLGEIAEAAGHNYAGDEAILPPTMLPSVPLEDMPAYKAHLEALKSLHPYPGTVVRRESLKDKVETEYADIYEEKVFFTDGAIRTLTHALPKVSKLGEENISRFPISATDALMTGPSGFNAILIAKLVKLGYPVVWLHHQGRHSEKPTDVRKAKQLARFLFKKSVGRSAHHQHGLLDDLSYSVDYDTANIVSLGDSRGAMTGEAFDALADMYGRHVSWSDYIAGCFEHRPKLKETPALIASPLKEGMALVRMGKRLKQHENDPDNEYGSAKDYKGTFDVHPMNLLHEAAWFPPLMRGDAGRYADAVPLDRNGARTYLNGDIWSSRGRSWESKHSIRPGIYFFQTSLPDGAIARHLDLADRTIQFSRFERLERLLHELAAHDFLSSAVDFKYVATGERQF